MFADVVVRERGFGRGDGEQGRGGGFVDLPWGAGFRIWFGVLDFVAVFGGLVVGFSFLRTFYFIYSYL